MSTKQRPKEHAAQATGAQKNAWTWSTLTASDKISLLAFIVSLFALGLTVVSAYQEREHRRLSVTPKLNVDFVEGSDEKVTGIVLSNPGLGPARVLNLQAFVNGKFVAEAYDDEQWQRIITALAQTAPRALRQTSIRFKAFTSDIYLPPGQTIYLLFQRNSELTADSLEFLHQAKAHLQIGICFCSLYEQCWSYVSPGLQQQPCESPLARYHLLHKGPLADKLKDVRRSIEPWSPH